MALGGGVFTAQNKVLPGAYINFVSAARGGSLLSERGVAAMPLALSWGVDGEIFTVTADEFLENSLRVFGYPATAPEMTGLRDLFLHIREGHFYKLNTGGAKAACALAEARHMGARGNALRIVVYENEFSAEEAPLFDVQTYFDTLLVDEQLAVPNMAGLSDNDYVVWKRAATLDLTAGMPLVGGMDGAVASGAYQTFLDKIEPYSFNTLGLVSTDEVLKGLFASFTRRMRDEVGVKFQCVLYQYEKADYEGVISVENKLSDEAGNDTDSASLVYWVTGAEAGCAVNQSLTNRKYNGEYDVHTAYTQRQLEQAIKAGKLMFHKAGSSVRVLTDINTLTTRTEEKGEDFRINQTVRVLDQIGNDIAALFNERYLGAMPNDAAGRISLWNDIVRHHQTLQTLRAIENYDPALCEVLPGENKRAVVVTDHVTPVNAMEQLYMTVVVE